MTVKTSSLRPDILNIAGNKGTEIPFTGAYTDSEERGTYLCRQCGLALFRSHSKFHSGCGWPSFDDEILKTVKRIPDSDRKRTEILCSRCDAHLGHVFAGEGFTDKNLRHCVNSLSLDFVADLTVEESEEAIFAAGCFWGVEHYLKKLEGVLKTEVGYSGGQKAYPTYKEICAGNSGHFEVIRVLYNSQKTDFEKVTKYFFEIHDFTQKNGQGPDIGEQYKSVIFYYDDKQKETAQKIIKFLSQKGYEVQTQLLPVSIFWQAEEYHQNYYEINQQSPYCHRYQKIF